MQVIIMRDIIPLRQKNCRINSKFQMEEPYMKGYVNMLEWNEIKGINNNYNYRGNVNNGVKLPNLNEIVLFCREDYKDEKRRDIYFDGFIQEGKHGLVYINNVVCSTSLLQDGIMWARFNKPKTKNNIGYAIAYLDRDGNGFCKDTPYITLVDKKEDLLCKIEQLSQEENKRITAFEYINPCDFANWNWEYIDINKVI